MAREKRPETAVSRVPLVLALIPIVLIVAADRSCHRRDREVAKQARAQLASEDISVSGDPSVSPDPFNRSPPATTTRSISSCRTRRAGHQHELAPRDGDNVNALTSGVISGHGQIEADRVVGTARSTSTASASPGLASARTR